MVRIGLRRAGRWAVWPDLHGFVKCEPVRVALLSVAVSLCLPDPSVAADLSARDVTVQLYKTDRNAPANFEEFDLTNLDLSGVDFKRAHMRGANLFGVDLSHANLNGVDLRAARLDRVTITGANFSGANLTGASLLRPSVFSAIDSAPASEVVNFEGADLRKAIVFGQFNRSNFRDVNLEGANLSPIDASSFIEHIWRSEFLGADMRRANLRDAKLERVLFAFADLSDADLSGANLKHADMSGADLRGADLTNADVTNADLTDVKLHGARGLDTVIGFGALRGRIPKALVVYVGKAVKELKSTEHQLYRVD